MNGVINQDPWWRARVLPLFSFDPNDPDKRPVGFGTVFRIDPFGSTATAFHVIEEILDIIENKLKLTNSSLCVLDVPERVIIFGTVVIPSEWWRPLESIFSLPVGVKSSPLLHVPNMVQNISELATLGFPPHNMNSAPYLPVCLRGALPEIGDILTAYGYANLDVGSVDKDPIGQELFSFSGAVTEIIHADTDSTRPWPRVMVKAHWPSGMSGGPVVNAKNEVIGLVSTSFDGTEQSSAHVFAGWNIPEQALTTLDPDNPGWFRGFAAIDNNDVLRFFGHDPVEVQNYAELNRMEFKAVSFEPKTGDWIN